MSKRRDQQGLDILLVEDNPGDVALIQEALQRNQMRANLHVVGDGEKALQFLYRKNRYTDAPSPDLILLDLNLPKVSGCEVLKTIKSDEHLRRIPVVVLTTSEAKSDIEKVYASGANCYITKPPDLDGFFATIGAIEEFWMHTAALPMGNYSSTPAG